MDADDVPTVRDQLLSNLQKNRLTFQLACDSLLKGERAHASRLKGDSLTSSGELICKRFL
jgi:hypothetical protein